MQKRRNKTTEKSRVFYKMYLVNIIITMVFICLISMVCSTLSSRLILDNFIKYNEDMIAEKRNVMDERIRQLEETCNLITSEGAAFRFIMTNYSGIRKADKTFADYSIFPKHLFGEPFDRRYLSGRFFEKDSIR